MWLLGGGSRSLSSGGAVGGSAGGAVGVLVDRIPCRSRFILPMIVGVDFLRCFRIKVVVRPGQVVKKLALIALQNELTGGYPAVAWRNIARFFLFF